MATVELAHQLRQCATFFVASQDNEPVEGWPYDEILKTFNNQVDVPDAAINIVDAYGRATDDEATLSAVDLRVMGDLATALDHLGDALLPFVSEELPVLARAREEARTFSNFDSIDLYGYLQGLKRHFRQSVNASVRRRKVMTAADAVLTTLDKAVIRTSKDPKLTGAHGLSVYLPNSLVMSAYHDLPLSTAAPGWHRFVVVYGALRHLIPT